MRAIEKQIELKPEEQMCIAHIVDCDDTVDETAKRSTRTTLAIASALYDENDVMTFDTKFIGVARCHTNDEYQEHMGIDLASTKADMKYHRRMAKDYAKYIADCERAIREFTELKEMHERKVRNIEEDIQAYYIDGTKK